MKVNELIAQLRMVDQDLQVLCCAEDENLVAPGHLFRLLEIDGVEVTEGERMREESGVVSLRLGSGSSASKMACLSVTSDF